MGGQTVADPDSVPAGAFPVTAFLHAVAGQSGNQEHRLTADIVVFHTVDHNGGQAIAFGIDKLAQEVIGLSLVVGTVCIDRRRIHVDSNAVLAALAVSQSHIEANLTGDGIQALTQMHGVGIAELIVLAILLQGLLFAGFPVIVGIREAIAIGLLFGACLIGVDTLDGVLGDGVAVSLADFVAVGIVIHGHILGSCGIVFYVDVGQILVGLEVDIAPIDGVAALLGTGVGGGIRRGILCGVVVVDGCVVALNGCIISIDCVIVGIHIVVVCLHCFQIAIVSIGTQSGILACVRFQRGGFCQQCSFLIG